MKIYSSNHYKEGFQTRIWLINLLRTGFLSALSTIEMKKIDLLLINPSNRKQTYQKLSNTLSGIEPPIWCGLTAAFIRNHGYNVAIIDADAENIPPKSAAKKTAKIKPLLIDIVVLGTNPSASSTPKMSGVKDLLNALKITAPHIKTILSGLHPSALPERTLNEEKTDYVCRGEGFHTILQLLKVLSTNSNPENHHIKGLWYKKNNKIVSNSSSPYIKNLDKLPFTAWDLLPMDKYRAHNWHCFEDIENRSPYAVIYTSLGCPFKCYYCPIHSFYGKPCIRYRSPENVIKEIDILVKKYNVKNIKFMDELFVFKQNRVIEICNYIIKRGYKLNIWVYARPDIMNQELLHKMKKAGINWIAYGIESASEQVRKGVSKKIHWERIKQAVEMTRNAGIYIIANFLFGLPDDDFQSMEETLSMAKKYNFEYVNFYVCMPYPGSELYEKTLEKKIKLPDEWHGFGQYSYETLPLPTKYLKPEEVLRFRDKAFIEYYSNPDYLKMINNKFGLKVSKHINEMLKYKIKRKYI